METARFLDSTAGNLVKLVTGESAETVEARRHRQRFQGKKVSHFLYAVVFELAIKIIWSIDNRERMRENARYIEPLQRAFH